MSLYRLAPLGRFLTALSVLLSGNGACAEPPDILRAVRFAGNDTTQESVLRQEMVIREGDRIDEEAIARSRQAIMNLGLFKSVESRLEPLADGYLLEIRLEEKYYILPVPRLDSKADGSINYGMELRFDNLRGLNQRLNLLYRNKDSVNGDEPLKKEMALEYSYPRIVGTPYRLDARLETLNETAELTEGEVEVGAGELDTNAFSARLSRWLDAAAPSGGWRAGAGLSFTQRDYEPLWGVTPPPTSWSNALALSLEYVDVYEYRYHREGRRFGYNVEFGVQALGSDYTYARQILSYTRYLATPFARYSNFNWRLQLGAADGYRFDEEAFHLGGGDTLRGFSSNALKGDAMLLANLEYLFPVTGYPFIRGAIFLDVGNTYPTLWEADLADLEAGGGVGLQWRVQSLVDVIVNVNWGFNLATGEGTLYASTSRAF